MAKSVSKLVFPIAAVMLVLAGCGGRSGSGGLAISPSPDTLSVPPDFAARAIDGCGGMKAWVETKAFDFSCIATFYQADGSHYLTEHEYTVYPWSNSVQVSGSEPGGDFLWELRDGDFSVIEGGDKIERITEQMEAEAITEAVLTATVVPALLLDSRGEFAQMAAPLKLDGRWYGVVTRTIRPELQDGADMTDVVFYQNRDTAVIDRVLIASGQKVFLINSYGYREVQKGGVLVPIRLEVHEADDRGASLRRLIKIDLK